MRSLITIIFLIGALLSKGASIGNSFIEKESSIEKEKAFPLIHRLSVISGFDYVASSVDDDIREQIPASDKIYLHSAAPVSLRYSFSFTDPEIRNFYKGGYQGVSVGVLNIGGLEPDGGSIAKRNIGYPVMAYIFQGGPVWQIRNNLSLDYEWNFGAAFGWKPYSVENKNFNLTVGSRINAYLNLNFNLRWELSECLGLMAGIGISHFSNGNTSFPNPGINSFGIRVGILYTLNPNNRRIGEIRFNDIDQTTLISATDDSEENKPDNKMGKDEKRHRIEYNISFWGSTRKRVYRGGDQPVLLEGHFACAGVSFAPLVRLNKWWRVGVSLDLQYDHSAGMPKLKHETTNLSSSNLEPTISESPLPGHPSFWRQTSVGLSAHGELQMPIFAVNVGIGYNLVAPWENRGSYQNITLKTYLCSRLYLNVGYQLRNFQQQSSLMLGLGVTL